MYGQYISFGEDGNLNICNDDFDIIETAPLGESTINFLENDYSQYASFYNDLHDVLVSNIENVSQFEDLVISSKLDKNIVDNFFIKYPKLKEYIMKKKAEFFDYIYMKYSEEDEHELLSFMGLSNTEEEKEFWYFLTKKGTINRMVDNEIYNRTTFKSLSWDFIFNFDCPNEYISNINEIRNNLFVLLAYDDMSDESALKFETAFHHLKDVFWDPFIFCFDIEYNPLLNDLTAIQRFYLFNKMYPESRLSHESTEVSFSVKSNTKQLQRFDELNEDIIKAIQKQNIKQMQLYQTVNINNMLYIEFHKMLEMNIKVMKCKNCGKYFILKGNYNAQYCDRIPKGEKHTCQKIAATNKMREKINNNPILKEYQRAYKRKYAQVSNKKLSKEMFRIWVEEATKTRDIYATQYEETPNKQVVKDFKNYLGNK